MNRTTVHLSLHPASRDTNYLGFMQLPFMQGATQARSGEISAAVRRGSTPVGSTVNGLVTREPGTYSFVTAVDAMQEGWAAPQRITENTMVQVH